MLGHLFPLAGYIIFEWLAVKQDLLLAILFFHSPTTSKSVFILNSIRKYANDNIFIVKFDPTKTSSRRKMRKAHFGATSVERHVRMSSALSKDLFMKYKVLFLTF